MHQSENHQFRFTLKGFAVDAVLFIPRLIALPIMLMVACAKLALYDPFFGDQTY